MGFRGRQIVALIFVAAAVAGATGLVSAALLARTKVADARDDAELIALALFSEASRVIRQHSMEELREALARDEALRTFADSIKDYGPTILHVAISDADGLAIFHSDPDRQDLPIEPEVSLRQFSKRTALGQLWALSRAQGGLVFDQPFSVEGEERFGAVRVTVSAVLLKRDLIKSVTVNTLLATTVVLVAFIVSFYVANRLLAPLAALRDQLARLNVGEDRPPLELRTKEDVGRIAEFFDSLGRRLAADQHLDAAGLSLKTLVTGLNDAVIVLAADLRIVSLNDPARRLLDSEAAPGRRLDELLPADHPVRVVVDEALERGRSETIQPVPVPGEKEPVSYMLGANRLSDSDSDRTSGVLVTARDLQRLSRVASQLSYAQKLASLGRLTSGVSHELRNPLNAMTMHLAILRKKLASRSSEADHHLNVLEEELGRLGRVVKGFLDFSRPEEIELHRVDVDSVILTAIGRVRHLAEANGIAVNFHADAQLPQVIANFHLLEQAFVNLLTNSCEAMPDGGRIEVRASPSDGHVILVIEDTGPGIPPEKLPQVFNLYFTTKERGSGIGLSLVYRIVQLHGGEIRIDSEPGAGTRATITLQEGSL